MRDARVVLAAAVAVTTAACAHKAQVTSDEGQSFDCRARTIAYVAAHTMGAAEIGVEMSCANGPSLKHWRVDEKTSKRDEQSRPMTPAEFDKVWAQVAGTGWENLKDCTNGDGGKSAPLYQFDVKDDQNTASFSCQSLRLPYPYNDLADPLDAAVQGGGNE
jgi:hypothetical protein|nr:hypothetical protein [Kofleriaceae bacterium]